MYMRRTWLRRLRMSSYKMESPNPQSTEWIAGNARLFSRSLQLEHKWNKTRRQLEHKWSTHPRNGTQLEHKWDTAGTCITSDDAICGWVLTKWNHQTLSLQNGLLEKLEASTRISFFLAEVLQTFAFTFIVARFMLMNFVEAVDEFG